MHPEYDPTSGEIFKSLEMQPTPAVDGQVGSQLSQTPDVHAARNYFQTANGQAQLPDLRIDAGFSGTEATLGNGTGLTGTGSESALLQGATNMPGMETSMISSMPGLDQAILPGLEQGALAGAVPPGGETISPLVQMILKMPGLTGLVGDFFSALMAFFFPPDGGGLMALLDPALWAAAAQHTMTSFATVFAGNLPMTLTAFGSNNPFTTLMQQGLMESGSKAASAAAANPLTVGLEHQPFTAQSLNVGGAASPGKAMFEMNSIDGNQFVDGSSLNFNLDQNRFLAMEGGNNSFGPTIGASSAPTANTTAPATTTVTPQSTPATGSTGGTGMDATAGADAPAQTTAAPDGGRGSLLDQSTSGSGTEIASAPEVSPHHMVQHGDNLWNIAKQHLGSGQRWTEIYDLNKNVIGSNPDLIYSGTDLKLPGGADSIASAPTEYMVKPGDNLWNIARDHLGGGKNWPSIYENNANIIGNDPNLIHPGQNLAIPDHAGASHMQVAHHAPSHTVAHHAPAHHAPAHHTAQAHHAPAAHQTHHQPQATEHVAQHTPAHHAPAAAGHDAATASNTTPAATADNAAATAANKQLTDAGSRTEEFGRTAQAPEDMKQEIGLKAVAKSL